MSFLDLFTGGDGSTKTSMPKWLNQDIKQTMDFGFRLASQPYTPYAWQRIAGFTGDQNKAMGMLRNYAPTARANSRDFTAPRLIDRIPGPGGKKGTIQDYENPYIDRVLNRTQSRIGQMAQTERKFGSNAEAVANNAFGDARHGVADAVIADKAMGQMKDAAAEGYASAFNNAMEMRNQDINRMFDAERMNADKQNQYMSFIDSLFRSGNQQQGLDQKNLDLAYQDFERQRQHPYEQWNMLINALNGTQHNTTTTTTQPSASPISSILAAALGIGSLI